MDHLGNVRAEMDTDGMVVALIFLQAFLLCK